MRLTQTSLSALVKSGGFAGQALDRVFGPAVIQDADAQPITCRWGFLRSQLERSGAKIPEEITDLFQQVSVAAESQERAEFTIGYQAYGLPIGLAKELVDLKFHRRGPLHSKSLLRAARIFARGSKDRSLLEGAPEELRPILERLLAEEAHYQSKHGHRPAQQVGSSLIASRFTQDTVNFRIVSHWLELPGGICGFAFLTESQTFTIFRHIQDAEGARAYAAFPNDPASYRKRRERLGLELANPRHPAVAKVLVQEIQGRRLLVFVSSTGDHYFTDFRLVPLDGCQPRHS